MENGSTTNLPERSKRTFLRYLKDINELAEDAPLNKWDADTSSVLLGQVLGIIKRSYERKNR